MFVRKYRGLPYKKEGKQEENLKFDRHFFINILGEREKICLRMYSFIGEKEEGCLA